MDGGDDHLAGAPQRGAGHDSDLPGQARPPRMALFSTATSVLPDSVTFGPSGTWVLGPTWV